MMPAHKKDPVEMMCSIGELAGLFEKSGSLDDFLQTAVSIIAWHMRAAVCSIYLMEPDQQHLLLAANQGFAEGTVGRLRIRLGEGLTGKAVQECREIHAARGAEHPDFKVVPWVGEERFEAFLAVPILRGPVRIGALVVQDPQPDYFDSRDSRALQAIAMQMASVIENARLLLQAHREDGAPPPPAVFPRMVKGIALSPGIAWGRALPLGAESGRRIRRLAAGREPRGAADFDRALEQTVEQLDGLEKELARKASDLASLIFSAQRLILKDRSFTEPIRRAIGEGRPAQQAIEEVFGDYERLLLKSANPRIQEKVNDLEDLVLRLLGNLFERAAGQTTCEERVVIARTLTPSELVRLSTQRAAGLVLLEGGATAHLSILARSLGLPAAAVRTEALLALDEEAFLLLDAHQGNLLIRPAPEVIAEFARLKAGQQAVPPEAPVDPSPAATRDGARVRILAAMNLLSDIPLILRSGAEGVGLYRSEFPFLVRDGFPSEEEQTGIYRKILESLGGRPVAFRTLDIGGDKRPEGWTGPREPNPALGLRALRFSLRHPAVFSQQIRALLRAAWDRELRILFPLVGSADEFRAARTLVEESIEALRSEGVPRNESPRLGLMIESPGAVETLEVLAREADFLSIGCNDLVQYLLAVDRANAEVAGLYRPDHPAVLRVLSRIAGIVERAGRDAGLCGDLAGDPRMLPVLVGIGYRSFTVEPARAGEMKRRIAELDTREAAALARRVLACASLGEVEAVLGPA